jgi:hypothetical protein
MKNVVLSVPGVGGGALAGTLLDRHWPAERVKAPPGARTSLPRLSTLSVEKRRSTCIEPGAVPRLQAVTVAVNDWPGASAVGTETEVTTKSGPKPIAMVKAGLKLAMNKLSEKPDVPKYVLALTVYEHDSGEIKVLALPQPSIRNQLEELDSKPDYEPITDWDLELSKKEEGGFVKYSLIALPRRRGQQASIDVAWEEAQDAGFDISRLVTNGDPFTAK